MKKKARTPAAPRERTIRIPGRSIKAIGGEQEFWGDLYHEAMTVSLPRFLAGCLGVYVANNVVFALLYALVPGSVSNVAEPRLLNLLFFSVEAFTTVGFGDMHPASTWGHIVFSLEGFAALVQLAALTGLIFSRFSRPRARILFAENPVIVNHDGKRQLMIRLANARHNYIADAEAQLWATRLEVTKEGQRFRRFHELPLARNQNPAFILSWTLFHEINKRSLLWGLDSKDLADGSYQFIVTIAGTDDSAAQELRDRKLYTHDQILWGRRYADILSTDDEGTTTLDYRNFHKTVEE